MCEVHKLLILTFRVHEIITNQLMTITNGQTNLCETLRNHITQQVVNISFTRKLQ